MIRNNGIRTPEIIAAMFGPGVLVSSPYLCPGGKSVPFLSAGVSPGVMLPIGDLMLAVGFAASASAGVVVVVVVVVVVIVVDEVAAAVVGLTHFSAVFVTFNSSIAITSLPPAV